MSERVSVELTLCVSAYF